MAALLTSVFIDYSNAFKRAGEMFCGIPEGQVGWDGIDGHFAPGGLADELVKANNQLRASKMVLHQVHVYCGIPARYVSEREQDKRRTEDERTAKWESHDNVFVHRVELDYEDGIGERGVDTLMAADLVAMAYDGVFDVAVLVSRDSDFQAVLYEMERLTEMRRETSRPCPRLDLAGWSRGRKGRAETVPVPNGLELLFAKHRLTRATFREVAEDSKLREKKPRNPRRGARARARARGRAAWQPQGAMETALREAQRRKEAVRAVGPSRGGETRTCG